MTSRCSSITAGTARLLAATCMFAVAHQAMGQTTAVDPLESGFRDPPNSARPRVWWHWLNGNITRDGIEKDLEWMKRAGIGGAQNFDANLATPQIVDTPLRYMTPEWKDAFHHAASVADRLGLELAIASSPGFSETGGPWVPSSDGMKKLVWSETLLAGGRRFTGKLASPPTNVGPFQTMPAASQVGRSEKPPAPFYADAAVVAFPVAGIKRLPLPVATSMSGQPLDPAVLADGLYKDAAKVDAGTSDRPGGVVLSYDRPQTIRSATMYIPGKNALMDVALAPRLDASMDGRNWQTVAPMPIAPVPTTVSFTPVTARYFRLVLVPTAGKNLHLGTPAPGVVGADRFAAMAGPAKSAKLAEFSLSAEARIDRFEAKAEFSLVDDYYALDSSAELSGIPVAGVIDLTARMKPDGTLDWTPPRGTWRVLRLGYSIVGTVNHPAPSEATGLEVDKMDGAAVRHYLETYLGMYRDAAGADLIGAHGVRALVNDSTEAGEANWTPRMIEQFKRLRGYDPVPWLPALTGTIIGSRRASDRFLFDFRRTITDLVASEHYGTIATVAHEHGLKVYTESLEGGRQTPGDDMTMRSHADVPMAAMWTYARATGPKPAYLIDIKGAASVAHIYGQNVVAAESLTSALAPWAHAPSDLRRIIDLEFAMGVNLPIIHTSVHQPLDKAPGLSFFIFGQYFTRHESWAEMARPWVDYIARNSFLLQQGRNFADVAYFYGEEAPLSGLFGEKPIADAPAHHGYDFVNADMLDKLSVDQGDLVAASGARYRLLYLGGSSRQMTLPVLRQIAHFAEAGATIVGEAPQSSPSLNDDRVGFETLVHRLWGGQAVTNFGAGRVIASAKIEMALAQIGVGPDFSYAKMQPDSDILFNHRKLSDGDIYFLSNRMDHPERFEARFRVTGKAPEIWRADTGSSETVSYRIEGAETIVPIEMAGDESFFIVFRDPATAAARTIEKGKRTPIADMAGPWNITFQPGRGAPGSTRFASLAPLSDNPDPAIRYFSGVATYRKNFTLPKTAKPGQPIMLDLGKVGDLAEVWINGRPVDTLWHAPYRIDIGKAVRTGHNLLEIRVANLWVNRLIGDAQPTATKIASTSQPTYTASAPLRPSGLIGPVTLSVFN